ncbi:MAG: peptidase C1 [Deltaproteobacteria bacterium]|nr:peptidase C1 [Deltaproteobacteria bacterium]
MKPITLAACIALLLTACDEPSRAVPPAGTAPPATASAEPARKVVEIQGPALEAGPGVTLGRYETRYLDPVIEELREADEAWKKEQGKATGAIRDRQEEQEEQERKDKKILKSSLPEDQRPASPDDFETVNHQPVQAQYYTGTCWSFGTTSFLESEVERITNNPVKLSEIATVYWEYQAKAARYVQERGDSFFVEGSECNSVTRMWKEHGAWPLAAYPGVTGEDPRHDHQRLYREMKAVLTAMNKKDLWDETTVLSMIRVIEDRELGRPPETFEHEGKTMTPIEFRDEVLKIVPDDYVQFISTLEMPFFVTGEFDVPDNWWHDDSYHNAPLEDFYSAIRGAITSGYSVAIAVDVSEPGKDAGNDVFFVPDYDIPGDHIDQLAREYRFAHKVTTDDHAVHVVGFTEHAGHDWFLIKDSGRSARHGKHEGYYFMRDDYVRLKVLSFMVHRDAVEELLGKFT